MSLIGGPIPDVRKPEAPTSRETGLINHSWKFNTGTSSTGTVNRNFVQVMNHQTASVDLYLSEPNGGRTLIAAKNRGDRGWTWKAGDNVLTQPARQALARELNSGSAFNRKLDDRLLNTAAQDYKGGLSDAINIYGKSINLTQSPADQSRGIDVDGNSGGVNGAGGNSGGSSLRDNDGNIKNAISNKIEARTKYASSDELRYPIAYSGNDFMQIEMLRYVPERNLSLGRSPDTTGADTESLALGNLRRPSERQEKEASIATITLPIPSNLTDNNLVDWKNDDLNAITGYFAGSATRLMGSGSDIGNQLGREVRGLGNIASKQGDALKSIITSEIVKQLVGAKTLLTRSTGAVLNQNTELLFVGPGLRSFSFSFKMTPRDQRESIAVKKIIRTLKQGMAVKRAVDGLFLSTPNIFRITFYYSTQGENPKKHPFLPTLKLCALQNMSVNYMPDGSYMTYGDGSMVAYDMTLNFGEIEPIFDTDYDELDGVDSKGNPTNPDSVIGY